MSELAVSLSYQPPPHSEEPNEILFYDGHVKELPLNKWGLHRKCVLDSLATQILI